MGRGVGWVPMPAARPTGESARPVLQVHAVHPCHDTAVDVEGHFRTGLVCQKRQRESIRVVPLNQLEWVGLLNSLTGAEQVVRVETFFYPIKFRKLDDVEDK